MERIDKSFILNDFNEKEADVVYKVNLGDTEVIFYILLELRYDDKKLFEIGNVISSVFYVDQERNYEGIFKRVNELLDHLKNMRSEDFNIFKTWLKNISVSDLGTKNAGNIRKAIDKSEEVEGMEYTLEMAIRDEIDKIKQEERQEGKRGGQIDSILELLNDFGNMSENLRSKIYAQDDSAILSSWHKIAAHVASLEEFEERISKLK